MGGGYFIRAQMRPFVAVWDPGVPKQLLFCSCLGPWVPKHLFLYLFEALGCPNINFCNCLGRWGAQIVIIFVAVWGPGVPKQLFLYLFGSLGCPYTYFCKCLGPLGESTSMAPRCPNSYFCNSLGPWGTQPIIFVTVWGLGVPKQLHL